jgi:hypothetical protein
LGDNNSALSWWQDLAEYLDQGVWLALRPDEAMSRRACCGDTGARTKRLGLR